MTTRYYLQRHLLTRKPMILFRDFTRDEQRSAEVLNRRYGWQVSSLLLAKRAGGEIDEADRITETAAGKIAATWGHDLG